MLASLTRNPSVAGDHRRRIVLNVGGIRFETYRSTLKNIPDTRLAWLADANVTNADFDAETGEYFFDRDPTVFQALLNYYRTGKLHVPSNLCGPLFEEELNFWGIDEKLIEACCWQQYHTHRDAELTLAELYGGEYEQEEEEEDEHVAERFGIQEEPEKLSLWQTYQPKIENIIEYKVTSQSAKVFAVISTTFAIISILTLVLETHPLLRVPADVATNATLSIADRFELTRRHPVLRIIGWICIIYFIFEIIFRFIFSSKKVNFFRQSQNIVDFLSILPFTIDEFMSVVAPESYNSVLIRVLNGLAITRVFRIFKSAAHFRGLRIISHTVRASLNELALLGLVLLIAVLIFSTLVFYAEQVEDNPRNHFDSIPRSFWWAIVTMTTIGYGDMYPQTSLGYLVGSFCAIAGVFVLALPVPIIVNNFTTYYSHMQAQKKLPKRPKRRLIGAHDSLKQQQDEFPSYEALDEPASPDELSPAPSPADNRTLTPVMNVGEAAATQHGKGMVNVSFVDDDVSVESRPSSANSVKKILRRDSRTQRRHSLTATDTTSDGHVHTTGKPPRPSKKTSTRRRLSMRPSLLT